MSFKKKIILTANFSVTSFPELCVLFLTLHAHTEVHLHSIQWLCACLCVTSHMIFMPSLSSCPLASLRGKHHREHHRYHHPSSCTSKRLHSSPLPDCRLCTPVTRLVVWFELILISVGTVGPFAQLKKKKKKRKDYNQTAPAWRCLSFVNHRGTKIEKRWDIDDAPISC